MAFTKTHYERVAEMIRTEAEIINALGVDDMERVCYRNGRRDTLTVFKDRLCTMFSQDNPRFDAERFNAACEPKK